MRWALERCRPFRLPRRGPNARCRKLLSEGVDPIDARRADRERAAQAAPEVLVFSQAAADYIAGHKAVGRTRNTHGGGRTRSPRMPIRFSARSMCATSTHRWPCACCDRSGSRRRKRRAACEAESKRFSTRRKRSISEAVKIRPVGGDTWTRFCLSVTGLGGLSIIQHCRILKFQPSWPSLRLGRRRLLVSFTC